MCGVMGLVGRPLNETAAKLSYQLASKLLAETVVRGSHATGAYALFPPDHDGGKNRCFVFKLDAPSSQFVKTKVWRGVRDQKPFLMLGHCRFYTHGSPQNHINNHPHLSDDRRLALIHNGVISGYAGLKKTFPCQGECDSEVLLRIIESETDVVEGIKRVFNLVDTGSMACLLSRYNPDGQVADFYAFRNDGNPLVWVDLREDLGQIFIASTKDIAEKAIKNSGMPASIREREIKEIPEYQIWHATPDALDWEITPVEKPVRASYHGGYYGTTWGQGAGTTSRAVTIPVTGSTEDSKGRKKLRALIDTIMENLTDIDEEVSSGKNFDLTEAELEKTLEGVAWDLEQLVNPALSGKVTGTVDTDPPFYD